MWIRTGVRSLTNPPLYRERLKQLRCVGGLGASGLTDFVFCVQIFLIRLLKAESRSGRTKSIVFSRGCSIYKEQSKFKPDSP